MRACGISGVHVPVSHRPPSSPPLSSPLSYPTVVFSLVPVSPSCLPLLSRRYRILWMCLIFIGSLGRAAGIKLSIALGAGEGRHARRIALVALLLALLTLVGLGAIVALFPRQLGSIFTSDEKLLDKYEEVRPSCPSPKDHTSRSLVYIFESQSLFFRCARDNSNLEYTHVSFFLVGTVAPRGHHGSDELRSHARAYSDGNGADQGGADPRCTSTCVLRLC